MPGPRTLALSLALLFGVSAAPAIAQSTSRVHVVVTDRDGGPSDARVTLTPQSGDGEAHTCETRNGTCDLSSVPVGRYVVTATPSGEGRSPLPRVVPVPAGVRSYEVRVRLL